MRDIQFKYSLTEEDFREATRHGKNVALEDSTQFTLLSFTALLLLLYGTPVIADMIVPPLQAASDPVLKRLILGIMPWLYVIAWVVVITRESNRRKVRAAWKGSPWFALPTEMRITDVAIHVSTPYTQAQCKWGMFLRLVESPNLFLLYNSASHFMTVPKRALPEGVDPVEFGKWISQRVNPFAVQPEQFVSQPDLELQLLLPRMQFRLGWPDYSKARRMAPGSRWSDFLVEMAFITPVFLAIMIFFYWVEARAGETGDAFLLTAVAAFVFSIFLSIWRNVRRWRKATHLHGTQTIEITAAGIRIQRERAGEWIGWGAIAWFRFKKKLFILVMRDGTHRLIPAAAFSGPKEARVFEELLQTHVMAVPGFGLVG